MDESAKCVISFVVTLLFTVATISAVPAKTQTAPYIKISDIIRQDPKHMTNSLHLSGIGTDYCIYYNSGSTSVWLVDWVQNELSWYKNQNFQASRLGFVWSDSPVAPASSHGSSVYVYNKMNQVLSYLFQKNMKGILTYMNNNDSEEYCGSTGWHDHWIEVANDFLDDDRVAAFSIFSEPDHGGSYETWDPGITSNVQFYTEMVSMAHDIHAVDPDRIVILPFGGLGSMYGGVSNYTQWITDLGTAGFAAEPYTMIDICHPYYFEYSPYDYGLTPAQKADWYATNQIAPMVTAFGANKLWAGETFIWVGTTLAGGTATDSLQRQFLIPMINHFVDKGVGFDLWALLSYSVRRESTRYCVEHSDWTIDIEEPEPPIPPPPAKYYTVTTSSDGNGQVSPQVTNHKVTVGQTFVCTAQPNIDYVFDKWELNGSNVSQTPSYPLNGVEDWIYTLVAYFIFEAPTEPDPPDPPAAEYYNVNIGSRTGVSTDLTGTQTLLLDETLTVNATLKNNYRFNYWLYDNVAEQYGQLEFTKTESSTGQHTLLPVVQYVSPPPPNTPISLPNTNVAPLAPNKMLSELLKNQQKIQKTIDIKDIIKRLKL